MPSIIYQILTQKSNQGSHVNNNEENKKRKRIEAPVETKVEESSEVDIDNDDNERANVKVEDSASDEAVKIKAEESESTATNEETKNNDQTHHSNRIKVEEVEVKLELDDEKKRLILRDRKYGDRVLLHRQITKPVNKGMMKLGGGNNHMVMFPSDKHPQRKERFEKIGKSIAMAYSEAHNVDAPKYAGQRFASVRMLPHEKAPNLNLNEHCVFSLFTNHSLKNGKSLGWEYCGEYQACTDEEDDDNDRDGIVEAWGSAHSIPVRKKKNMAEVTLRNNNWGKPRINFWRNKLTELLQKDDSPASMTPQWFQERKVPTKAELKHYEPVPPLAARARALGFRKNMTDEEFVKIMYELDEVHVIHPIQFVEYREEVYNYVKDGPTNRNASGNKKKKNERCATASDWYDYIDQYGDNL